MSLYPADGGDAETLIACCESSIYVAKERGGNTSHYFDAVLNERMMDRFRLEKDLRSAIHNGEFVTYFQPRVDGAAKVTGLEALVRWNSSARGRMIYPDQFIPLAERSGLIVEIGRQVLRGACECARSWLYGAGLPIRIAVNISPFQFAEPNLADGIREILRVTDLDPRFLELEITETSIMKNERESVRTLQELHEMGISLSIDDFGTGYSSLSKLRLYPIDLLKIDKSFVRDLPDDRPSAVLTRTIIDMAHNLGFGVVAEGVETKEQLDFLMELGCDHFQGYYFYRPLSPEDACGVIGNQV
jgi:EAL domain-containing protein (putative c-di-GMP-specific phosphodiesterase class I)